MRKEPPGSGQLRRAAYWEMLDTNICGVGYHARVRLSESAAPADQKLMVALFLEEPGGSLPDNELKLQGAHKEFGDALVEHLRKHNDRAAEAAAYWLAQEKHPAVMPILLEKLKQRDAAVRKWTALA